MVLRSVSAAANKSSAAPLSSKAEDPGATDTEILGRSITLADFVETVFLPEHVLHAKARKQAYYRAILKHIFTPERVDKFFGVTSEKPQSKARALASWPYLDDVLLCNLSHDQIQLLVSETLAAGYSTHTARHIRQVSAALFELAIKKQYLSGGNPAYKVSLPKMRGKEPHLLTLQQLKELLKVMPSPEKEMTLMLILLEVEVAEICGLQWRFVNLTGSWMQAESISIPPESIAIRNLYSGGELCNVKRTHSRCVVIPGPLKPILRNLQCREAFVEGSDFVLVNRLGQPINSHNSAARVRSMGSSMNMPWLSWRVFQSTRSSLVHELGMRCLESAAGELVDSTR